MTTSQCKLATPSHQSRRQTSMLTVCGSSARTQSMKSVGNKSNRLIVKKIFNR